jgi:hypothetical protein
MTKPLLVSLRIVSAAGVLLVSAAAVAQDPPPPPTYYAPPPPQTYYPPPPGYYPAPPRPGRHTHDGLFVRPFLGGARLAMSENDGGNSLKANGVGVSFGVAIGGAVAENVIIYGDLYFMTVDNPTVTLNGMTANLDQSMFLGGLGPGIAYFIEPVNIYLSASIGASKLQLHDKATNDLVASTQWGYGVNAVAGKEWWVSDNWGLGAALQFHYGSMEDGPPGPSPRVHSNAFGLLISSTFN